MRSLLLLQRDRERDSGTGTAPCPGFRPLSNTRKQLASVKDPQPHRPGRRSLTAAPGPPGPPRGPAGGRAGATWRCSAPLRPPDPAPLRPAPRPPPPRSARGSAAAPWVSGPGLRWGGGGGRRAPRRAAAVPWEEGKFSALRLLPKARAASPSLSLSLSRPSFPSPF